MGFRVTIWNGESRTYVAVPQPLLYQLHLHSVCKEQAGTTVPQIMEAYLPQTVLAEHYGKVVRHIVGTYQLSHSVYADIVLVLLAVASAECLLHLSLMLTLSNERLLDYGYKRKRSVRRLRFHNIVACHSFLVLQDLVLDAYSLAYEVHRRPFQPDDLAAAESVIGSYSDDRTGSDIYYYKSTI